MAKKLHMLTVKNANYEKIVRVYDWLEKLPLSQGAELTQILASCGSIELGLTRVSLPSSRFI